MDTRDYVLSSTGASHVTQFKKKKEKKTRNAHHHDLL